MKTFAKILAREMANHKFIIAGLDRHEWKELKHLLLSAGTFNINYWISNDKTIQIRRFSSGNNLRGVTHQGKRPSLFITNSVEHDRDINDYRMVVHALDPQTKEIKYVQQKTDDVNKYSCHSFIPNV